MPVLRVPLDDNLERAVDSIERTARINQVLPAGDGCLLMFVEEKRNPGAKETRG